MSDPPKKPGSLRDRIAAFENKGTTAAPPAPTPRSKPAGVSWKPRPRSPPPVTSDDEATSAAKASGMSAADAKVSIGQGVSLKERMAALQGLHAFGGGSVSPPPKPATEKPKWRSAAVVSPPAVDEDERDESAKPAVVPEVESDAQEHEPVVEAEHAAEEGEGQGEPDAEEEERQRRAAIAARMARLGGARVGMAPPVFGKKPDVKKQGSLKVEDDEHREKPAPTVSPPAEPAVVSPPETASITSQTSDAAATDYFEAKDPEHLSPEAGPTPPIRSPAMPVPAGPRRAAPPRKRAAKSPSPATANVLQEGVVNESPSPLPDAPTPAPEVSAPSVVQAESLGPHGDREPEITASQVEAVLESVDVPSVELAEETKEALADAPPPVAAGPLETDQAPEAPVHEDEADPRAAHLEETTAGEAETHTEVTEPTVVGVEEEHPAEAGEEHQQAQEHEHLEAVEEETEEEEAARRKRIAERLAKAGGVNPLSGPIRTMESPPASPSSAHSIPASVERRQSLRKDSHGSIASAKSVSSPPVPTSPKPEVPRRQGSVHSVHSQVSVEHPTRRMSQDERRYSVGEPEPVRTFAEDIVEEPEPHDQHEAVYEEQGIAEESYLPEDTGDEHESVHYADPTPIEEAEAQEEEAEDEEIPPPPPPRVHPDAREAASLPSRSPSKRLSVPPPRLPPPPPPPQDDSEDTSDAEPVKRLSVPPGVPPRPPPPPPDVEEQEEVPPPVHRELRPPVHPTDEGDGAREQYKTPEVTHVVVDHHEQPIIHSDAAREDYEDNDYHEELYEEPEYEGYEQDDAEGDDSTGALAHPSHRQEILVPAPVVNELQEEAEEEAPPPPPRRPSVHDQPQRVTSPPLPPGRRPSADQASRFSTPTRPPVPKLAPVVVIPPARRESEVLDDSHGDPIDPGFYSPPKSPSIRTQPLPVPTPPPDTLELPTAEAQPADEEEEDPEQARRRTIAERMAKLGGIRFGAPPPPPPMRRPQPPPESQESEEGAPQQQEGEQEDAPEEEDEFARKQRIAARIAGMGGMRFGMMPGAAPPVPRQQTRPTSPPAQAEEQPKTPTAPHRMVPTVPPPPPPPEPSEYDDGEQIEPEESEAEEVTYEEAQEEEEAPPPVPSRVGRHSSIVEAHRPPVPQTSRPPVPQVPAPQPAKRTSVGSAHEQPGSSNFTYPPPPTRRPSIPTRDAQNDFVMVGNDEEAEEPPQPPPRTVSLRKAHQPPSRTAPRPPPPLSAEPQGTPAIPQVDFGGETDLSLSGQWSEDSTNYPPPPPPPTKGEFAPLSSSRSDIQLTPEELVKQWGRVGVQIHETAAVLFDKSKKTLVGDGSYLGFVTAVLGQVPNAAHPVPPFDNFGYLIYMQTGGSVQKRISDVMPGDVIMIQEAKLKGHKGLQSYNQTAGVGEPLYAIVSDYELKKSKVRVFQANQHVGQQTVESVSYRLEDLKSGSVKIFRVLEA